MPELPRCCSHVILGLLAVPLAAGAAETMPQLDPAGKDETWQHLTAPLRARLEGLNLTGDAAKRWLPVVCYHCEKIQHRVDMKHSYAELYCNQVAAMVADLKAGRPPLAGRAGRCMPYLYWSDYIQSLQGLRLVVPPAYDPAKEYQFFMYYKMGGGLVWKADGKWVSHKAPGARFVGPWHPTLETCTRLGADTFHAWSSLSSQVKGRQGAPQEFAEALAALARDFAVSPDRGFASGYSDGGFTPLFLGSRFPHLLAGIAPEVANWQNTNTGTCGWLNLPILAIDGWGDAGYVRENIGRFHYLSTMGADIQLMMGMHGHVAANKPTVTGVARPGAPYDDECTFRYLMDWARARRRNRWPRRVRYGTFNLYWNRAYWVTIEDITEPALGALIDVRAGDRNRIDVKAKNIAAFRLSLSDSIVNPARPVRVVVNGREKYRGAFRKDLPVELVKRDASRVRKTHAMPGGVTVAMDQAAYADDLRRVGRRVPGQAWTQVRPTAGDEAARKLYARLFPDRSRKDTAVDEELIQNNHLVVWGGPDSNAFCARVADTLPVRIENGRFTIGTRVYDRPGQSVRFLCPNPLNPQRYLVVYAWNDLETVAARDFYGMGTRFFFPSAWGLREADCRVWGVEDASGSFSIDMAGGRAAATHCYTFDPYWQPPSEKPLGRLAHDVDFLSLHVLKADALREITGADVGLIGSLVPGPNRWRGFLPAGPVTLNDLATTHMFPDYIMTAKVTGAELKGILDRATVSTVLGDETDPAFRQGRSLTREQIRDEKVYTVAADYSACSNVLSYGADTSRIRKTPLIFTTPASFDAHEALRLPCADLRQTDIEVTEALAAYIEKRGTVKVRGLCGDLPYYVTNPKVHHCGAYDWAHIKFDIPLADPTKPAPTHRRDTLAIGVARPGFPGAAARENAGIFLRCSEDALPAGTFADLDQQVPVSLRTRCRRFSLQGSCAAPADLTLAPPGRGTAGEAVIVQVTLTNRGDTDVRGLVVLAASHNMKLEHAWPNARDLKGGKEHPGIVGLYSFAGHVKRPRRQGGVYLVGPARPVRKSDRLVIPGTGYARGLVGLRRELVITAGTSVTLPVLFIAANAADPAEPKRFDFYDVATALKSQLAQHAGRLPAPSAGTPGAVNAGTR